MKYSQAECNTTISNQTHNYENLFIITTGTLKVAEIMNKFIVRYNENIIDELCHFSTQLHLAIIIFLTCNTWFFIIVTC